MSENNPEGWNDQRRVGSWQCIRPCRSGQGIFFLSVIESHGRILSRRMAWSDLHFEKKRAL